MIRIKVVTQPTQHSIDGIDLDRYDVGREYEVGNTTGALFLAQGWGVPAPDKAPPPDTGSRATRNVQGDVNRELFPARYQQRAVAAAQAIPPRPARRRTPHHRR